MKIWPVVLLAILVAAPGCRSSRANQELVEREMRLLEDDIYHLQGHLDDYAAKLESCRRENAALRRQLSDRRRTDTPYDRELMEPPRLEIELPDGRFDVEGRRAPRDDDRFSKREGIDSVVLADEPTPSPEPPAGREPFFNTGGRGLLSKTDEDDITDYLVARVTINRLLTGGYNHDRRGGDEGVMVVVEPRNAAEQILNVPGELSVVVLDPADPEGPAVARWDFAPEEVASHFRRGVLAEGIHIRLPWPGAPPTKEQLHLYVRFVTADGEEFRADRPIRVNLLSTEGKPDWQTASRTPRDEPKPTPADKTPREADRQEPDRSSRSRDPQDTKTTRRRGEWQPYR